MGEFFWGLAHLLCVDWLTRCKKGDYYTAVLKLDGSLQLAGDNSNGVLSGALSAPPGTLGSWFA